MIVALAGRRIDRPNASPEHFPVRSVAAVGERIRSALLADGASALVSAAACGADLTALGVAETLGIRRRIVLPFPAAEFRAGSVVDRPGDWGPLFDRLVSEAEEAGDLEVLGLPKASAHPYERTNAAILDRALALGREAREQVRALVVWDGPLVGRTDYTLDFVEAAEHRGIPVRTIGSSS